MGAGISMRAGDEVVIKYTDIDMVKQMQENHGGWNDAMEECLVSPCKFIQFSGADAVVKAPSGRPYRLNSELLMKYNKPGESMLLTSEESVLRSGLEGGHKLDEVKCLIGQRVELVQKGQDGKCIVKHQSKVYTVNENCFERSDGTRKTSTSSIVVGVYLLLKFLKKKIVPEAGESMLLTSEESVLRSGLEGGNKLDEVKCLVGQRVELVQKGQDGKCIVKHQSKVYTVNENCFERSDGTRKTPNSGIYEREPLQKGDLVLISNDIDATKELQRFHGSSIMPRKAFAGQTGRVESVIPTGDVRVKICGMSILYNPLVLTKISEPNKTLNKIRSVDLDDDTEVKNQNSENGITDKTSLSQDRNGTLDFPTNRIGIVSRHSIDIPCVGSHSGDSALHAAVRLKDYEACGQLVEEGADVNALNEKHMSPIMLAAQIGSKAILSLLLLDSDARLNIGDLDNDTALHLAVQNSKIDAVRILLEAGADIKARNNQQFNPYHMAALRGHEKILELFLDKYGGSLVDLQKDDQFAAIHLATLNNHTACLRLLIKHNADLNIRNLMMQTALHIAVSQKYMDCVKILVESEAEVDLRDKDGDTPLHNAICLHNIDKMKKMSAMFGLDGMFKLMEGLQRGSDEPEDIAIYLVEHGASLSTLNSAGKSPLSTCEDQWLQEKLCKMQIEYGPTASRNEHVPLTHKNVHEKSYDDEKEEMRLRIQKLEDEKKCIICYDNDVNVTLGCGHRICETCAKNLYECPMCRKKIVQKIRTF